VLDTERLIHAGQEAAGKNAKETQMILNHKAAIELLVNSAEEIGINRFTLCNLHALLAENLLDHPPGAAVCELLQRVLLDNVCTHGDSAIDRGNVRVAAREAAAIRDPYEQSLFLMVQLPYLQHSST